MARNLLKTVVTASTLGFVGAAAPNAFAMNSGTFHNVTTAPTLSTMLSEQEQSALQDSLRGTGAIVRDEDTRRLFEQFSAEWIADTENISDARIRLIHPAYHKILALGSSVMPFIFDEMAHGAGGRWLSALDAITLGRVNPVLPEHEDDALLMCQDWLGWAKRHGLSN